MTALVEYFHAEEQRQTLITQIEHVVDGRVAQQTGIGGLAIKGAYKTVQKVKKGFVTASIEFLLDGWLGKIQVYWDAFVDTQGVSFSQFLGPQARQVAGDMLTVTDAHINNSEYKTVAKLYRKLRPTAQEHVAGAVPDICDVIQSLVQKKEVEK